MTNTYATASLSGALNGSKLLFNSTNNYSNGMTLDIPNAHIIVSAGGVYRISVGIQLQRYNAFTVPLLDTSGWGIFNNGLAIPLTTWNNIAIQTMNVPPNSIAYNFLAFETIIGLNLSDYIDVKQVVGSGAIINGGYLNIVGMF